ncbi:hypothetical protein LRP52_40435 [Photobacterium sp. ZSDE20]|uniref:Uncharacterized protein n=1 Tax=Photobacterium pectinilyticum TaxID=2906793 RepID=A0ABT1N9H0_9GAMM|nr:hypothetical protein [Photobacterium sp. ZSDE20]MCQ1060762.1 hypothetical protein [Photobacterium sp. ZSDE20]MDD1828451.1 hypothetical protein [Photobacterium sp. ZSDE20]
MSVERFMISTIYLEPIQQVHSRPSHIHQSLIAFIRHFWSELEVINFVLRTVRHSNNGFSFELELSLVSAEEGTLVVSDLNYQLGILGFKIKQCSDQVLETNLLLSESACDVELNVDEDKLLRTIDNLRLIEDVIEQLPPAAYEYRVCIKPCSGVDAIQATQKQSIQENGLINTLFSFKSRQTKHDFTYVDFLAEYSISVIVRGAGSIAQAAFMSAFKQSMTEQGHTVVDGTSFKRKFVPLEGLLGYLPGVVPWSGSKNGMPLKTKSGSRFCFNPFDSFGNYNVLVEGDSASIFAEHIAKAQCNAVSVLSIGRLDGVATDLFDNYNCDVFEVAKHMSGEADIVLELLRALLSKPLTEFQTAVLHKEISLAISRGVTTFRNFLSGADLNNDERRLEVKALLEEAVCDLESLGLVSLSKPPLKASPAFGHVSQIDITTEVALHIRQYLAQLYAFHHYRLHNVRVADHWHIFIEGNKFIGQSSLYMFENLLRRARTANGSFVVYSNSASAGVKELKENFHWTISTDKSSGEQEGIGHTLIESSEGRTCVIA